MLLAHVEAARSTNNAMAKGNKELASRIEHTALKPDLLDSQIIKLCREAIEHNFHGVCVPPWHSSKVVQALEDYPQKAITVVGFPMGYDFTSSKVETVRKAFEQGVDEIDMVVNIAALKNGKWSVVRDDIEALHTLATMHSKVLKVIIETALLSEGEVIKACETANELGLHFVKTSTGFNGAGADLATVKLMRGILQDEIRIKASGGIKTAEQAQAFVDAGADRIGTSSGLAIVTAEQSLMDSV
jgi:deoxyribose-phosphate aldolase